MKTLALVTVLLCILGLAKHVKAADHDDLLPYQRIVLGNGLTVIVSEDHKAPVVGIALSYHVGSKDEVPGKTGLAHLFEHLMFLGSSHSKENYDHALEPLGASGINGTTDEDRTLYIETVPRSALDTALFLESDRMKWLVIDQERLDAARAVIRNEKALADASVYVRAWSFITPNTWPAGHPYAHAASGSIEDLNALTVDDAKSWFERYYTPNNAVLTLAGDIDPTTIEAQVRKYFEEIPPGPPLGRPSGLRNGATARIEWSCRIAVLWPSSTTSGMCPVLRAPILRFFAWPPGSSSSGRRGGSMSGWCTERESRPGCLRA